MTDFSILDLVPVREGGTVSEALAAATDLAVATEQAGCKRFWVAEHHAMDGIAGGATSVVLAHIANATSTIRIGSGGIMLPNHTPFQIAEQFGTLAALYPGRVDLGLGRAPGAGPELQRALRKDLHRAAEMFPHDVVELRAFLSAEDETAIRVLDCSGHDLRRAGAASIHKNNQGDITRGRCFTREILLILSLIAPPRRHNHLVGLEELVRDGNRLSQ